MAYQNRMKADDLEQAFRNNVNVHRDALPAYGRSHISVHAGTTA